MKQKIVNEKWSDTEILKLVELVNKHGDKWDDIVNEFDGKKTKEDCISQFLIMPIRENINYKVSDVSTNNMKVPQTYLIERIVNKGTTYLESNKKYEVESNKMDVEHQLQSAEIREENDSNILNSNTTVINNNYITVNNTKISNFNNNLSNIEKINNEKVEVENHQKNNHNNKNHNSNVEFETSRVIINQKTAINSQSSCINDLSNPLISQLVFFSKMFQKFVEADAKNTEHHENKDNVKQENDENKLENTKPQASTIDQIKENIYKTYAKGITRSNDFQNEEKTKIKMIIDLLIHTQLKKIELKLDYFNEFERLMEFEIGQMKTMESNLVQDRVKFAIKKVELNSQIEKLKYYQSQLKNDANNSKLKQNSLEGPGSLKEKNLIALTNSGNKYKEEEENVSINNVNNYPNQSHLSNHTNNNFSSNGNNMLVDENAYLPGNSNGNYAEDLQ